MKLPTHPRFKDLTGLRFGKLTVLSLHSMARKKVYRWKCKCDCGNESVVQGTNLTTKHTTSCGCFVKEKTYARSRTHGMGKTKLYYVWRGMLNRCSLPSVHNYARYGGRGITVCDEWKNPASFLEWALSHGYREGLQIERRNNDGNYEPSNCFWATRKEQGGNTRRNVFFEINGTKRILSDWARAVGLSVSCVHARLKRGWDIETALIVPSADIAGTVNAFARRAA